MILLLILGLIFILGAIPAWATPTLQLGAYTAEGGYGTGTYADYLDWSNPNEEDTALFFGNKLLAAGTYGPNDLLIGGQYDDQEDWPAFSYPNDFSGKGALLLVSLYLESGEVSSVTNNFKISVDGADPEGPFYWKTSYSELSFLPAGVRSHAPVEDANLWVFFDLGNFIKEQTGMPNFADETVDNAKGEIKEIVLEGLYSEDYQISWAHFDLLALVTRQNGPNVSVSIGFAPFSHDTTWKPIPEPATFLLVSTGLVLLGKLRNKKKLL